MMKSRGSRWGRGWEEGGACVTLVCSFFVVCMGGGGKANVPKGGLFLSQATVRLRPSAWCERGGRRPKKAKSAQSKRLSLFS
jgi:hypothetical protein